MKKIAEKTVTVMKQCCGMCPYARKGTLWGLHEQTYSDFAYQAANPYVDFVCHKTGVVNDDDENAEYRRGEKSLTCAGFHVMQNMVNETEDKLEIPYDEDVHFSCIEDMLSHHYDINLRENV